MSYVFGLHDGTRVHPQARMGRIHPCPTSVHLGGDARQGQGGTLTGPVRALPGVWDANVHAPRMRTLDGIHVRVRGGPQRDPCTPHAYVHACRAQACVPLTRAPSWRVPLETHSCPHRGVRARVVKRTDEDRWTDEDEDDGC
jgi:hypothetical protein